MTRTQQCKETQEQVMEMKRERWIRHILKVSNFTETLKTYIPFGALAEPL